MLDLSPKPFAVRSIAPFRRGLDEDGPVRRSCQRSRMALAVLLLPFRRWLSFLGLAV